jgi:thiol-disulfide isomerase/thioredoxin
MKKGYVYGLIALVVLVGLPLGYWAWYMSQPGKNDTLAQCISDSGAKFYGAFWCPHCQAQKKLFEKSAKLLPYVECSLPNGKGQTQVCIDKQVTSYPTWEFADGTRLPGEQTLAALSEKTSCPLP